MTLEEKKELINSAESLEELEKRQEEIAAEEAKVEEVKEEIEETTEADEVQEEEKAEEVEETKQDEEITPEEERSLLKDTMNIEKRSVQITNSIERKGEVKMEEVKELRNSREYVEAYAEYVKGRKEEKELRALITTGGTGDSNSKTVEVPDLVYDIVKTAWEREDLMSRVRTISAKGNLKVQFEVSGDAAVAHTEGDTAVSEEQLVLGVVEIKPVSIKKWISISDEALDMRGEEFLNYIYDELTYRIAKKCADLLIGKIKALPQSLSANASGVYDTVSAAKITAAPAVGTIANAIANLSDETRDITIVMNKLTWGAFKDVQYANNFNVDPFEGATVVFNNSLPAYSAANANAVYAIVGDFGVGALANRPTGADIELKYDDATLMTQDLVRILGRKYIGAEPVADRAFTLLAKPASV